MRKCALLPAVAVLLLTPPASGSHHPPKGVFAKARLFALPPPAIQKCKELQSAAPFTVLCPSRLPRAQFHWRHEARAPRLTAEFYGDRSHPRRPGLLGLGFGYGAPVEPQSGRWFWRRHAWLNRPAYFLHFVLFRQGPEALPSGLRRRCFAARCGLVKYADGYGLQPGRGFYWANHTWFFWTERGTKWAVSLHYFGRSDTTALLAELMQKLTPAADL